MTLATICVYCGSADGIHPEYIAAARQMGQALARRGITLVYGGGRTGLMGNLADQALADGGRVIGIIPETMYTPEVAHAGLSAMEVYPTMHQRKARMSELADAFIALPGGYGTLDELFETLTWAQIGLHNKPVGLLNTHAYYDPLLSLVRHATAEGFIYSADKVGLVHSADPGKLLDMLEGSSEYRI